MQQDYIPDSFKKGKQFEEFVERNIFPKEWFELVTRTNSYEQNSERYAEDTLKPDFKFRCKTTGQEFWVEAKYRSDFFQDQIEALSHRQRERFYVLEKDEGLPVFVIIGYWGYAYNPNALSLIPLKDYEFISIYRSFLRRYEVPNQPVTFEKLGFQEQPAPEQKDHTKHDEEVVDIKEIPAASEAGKYFNPKTIGIAAALLLLIFSIYSFAFSEEPAVNTPEEQLKEIVADYYQSMNSNQIEKLPKFLSPQVDHWYGAKNLSHSQIMKIARDRHGKYPYSTVKIDWESFTVIPQSTGDYLVTYNMTYGFKKKITDDYQMHYLKMLTRWDADLKLKGITETPK
ncbi:MAG: hypothetical protein WBL21_11030 [Salinimicrobium sp.]